MVFGQLYIYDMAVLLRYIDVISYFNEITYPF